MENGKLRPILRIILGGKGPRKENPKSEESGQESMSKLSSEIIQAIKNGDAKALSTALSIFKSMQ